MLNSNKRSLAINTKTPEGLAVMEQLIRGADVLVENFAPGAMDRMGLSLGASSGSSTRGWSTAR